MIEAVVVCEGQTEATFVKDMLAPELGARGMFLHPRIIATSPSSKGGSLTGQRVLRFLRNTLRERNNMCVTTFFDLYALPADFPGRSEAGKHSDAGNKAGAVERAFHAEVLQHAKCRPERFFPHIQPYEFEALLFSDPARFVEVEAGWEKESRKFAEIRRAAGGPEYVNDRPDTHPSALLTRSLSPRYNKARHGLAVSRRIGLDRIRAECRHFDRWLAHMETLADGAAPCRP